MSEVIHRFKEGMVVSCQALEEEPLFGSENMAAMAMAAEAGGAAGIRANTPQDIAMIKRKCSLPVIGLYKHTYAGSPVYITPTINEVRAVVEAGADLVAVDATKRARPDGITFDELYRAIRKNFPAVPIVADVSTFDEGAAAMELGCDLISTTMSGYTPYSTQAAGPDIELVAQLAKLKRVPVIAEGRIWTAEECLACFDAGAYAVVVGTAITRPQEITKRFVGAISQYIQSRKN
ncbi:N-acetylmannosamine-6-phosphate 2-epimerase [Cohnella kolymensis]|uniref:Putative N-acetylmannosamine-6-phosphate 2-epimerase n=1 Tax=Cohnella kolymensis TaxID=1590652 RepID=A0ABR5A625_9BACL|nr:N-acetylmannosamine-6-phosphate 2-epimerase [Cohnella kolymensis]KIL36540.1 N-acetylmannosamine-6-phosphate 2-epimerase [Cohnella kolymensis]